MKTRGLYAVVVGLGLVGCAGAVPSPEPVVPADEAVVRPTRVVAAEADVALRDDLPALHKAGVLRVLVHQAAADEVPRAGSAAAEDRSSLEALATELDLPLQWVVVADRSALVPALLAGKGDVVGEPLVVEKTVDVAFAPPLRFVDLTVVVPSAARTWPKGSKDLGHATVTAHASSGATAALAKLKGVSVKTAPESIDDQELLARVGGGTEPLAVVRSDALASYRAYDDDVRAAFALVEQRPVAWAVRPASSGLREAMAAFLYARELTLHKQTEQGGDLDAILKRKALRVAMLNNGASYFVYRGQEVGFQYDLAALLASRLGVRLEIVVPERPSAMESLIAENKVDLVPVSLGEGAPKDVMDFSLPFASANYVLVQPAGEPAIVSEAQLAGRAVHIRHSSAYFPLLEKLAARVPGLSIVDAAEHLETEDLIDLVGEKKLPLTVSNSVLLDVELTYRSDVQGTLVLATEQSLVYGLRKGTPKLKERLDKLLERELQGTAYQTIYAKYFRDKKRMAELLAAETSTSGKISPYDDSARRWGSEYNVDWRLVLAQMYQESRFDPNARSWVGAVGLMQVMPRTGIELGVRNLRDPDSNIKAGVRYLSRLISRFDPDIPMRQRVRFALAGYNAGHDHVVDARILARKRGLEADRWFGQVEQAMLLLEKPQYYRRARRGYCRGREPVAYVSRIQTKYEAYAALMPGGGLAEVP